MGPDDPGRRHGGGLDHVVEMRPGGDWRGGHAAIEDVERRAEAASGGAVSHGFLSLSRYEGVRTHFPIFAVSRLGHPK
jgi:hypothetical protein